MTDQLFSFSKSDIPLQDARDAHRGTSWVSDERGDQEQQGYVNHMQDVNDLFSKWVTPENRADMVADLTWYKDKYVRLYRQYLYSRSRCMSSMIAGPSNFPTRKAQKANDAADSKMTAWLEWEKKAIERLKRRYDPVRIAHAPISSDDPQAVEKLEAKIEKAEDNQEYMKAINKIVRRKTWDEDKKRDALDAYGLTEAQINFIFNHPIWDGSLGFEGWQLSNNNANIRRMKKRVEELKRKFADETTYEEYGPVTIIDNVEENRVQIDFPDKPSENIRAKLRKTFRWRRSEGLWQRHRSTEALRLAREIVAEYNQEEGNAVEEATV